jgi:hypothetical protein
MEWKTIDLRRICQWSGLVEYMSDEYRQTIHSGDGRYLFADLLVVNPAPIKALQGCVPLQLVSAKCR